MMIGATGFGVTCYPMTWIGMGHHMPVLLLITTRILGDQNQIYSIATHIVQPFLERLGFPVMKVDKIADVRKIVRDASDTCFAWMKPVAVLFSGEVIDGRVE